MHGINQPYLQSNGVYPQSTPSPPPPPQKEDSMSPPPPPPPPQKEDIMPPPPPPPPQKIGSMPPPPPPPQKGNSQQPPHDVILHHPFTMMLAGPTGSGKTFWMKTLLERARTMITPSPERIIWCYKRWQPLFSEMQQNIKKHLFVKVSSCKI
ncbi:unnamed protein product [Mytilus edulis]|uniref:Uncharacterized protein n=1 Tax=Mytilus edulis TaxID=6550 RepID=A0A8S3QBL8_MYTED|nr:unnamed protein product [Mytilus edulis]